MLPELEFQQHQQQQQMYAMRQEAQQQQQQRYGHNIVPSFVSADSGFLKHQNGFDRSQAHHQHHVQDGWYGPKKHQNGGWSSGSANYQHHVSGGGGGGGGKRMPYATPGFNGTQQYSEASLLKNGMGNAHEYEFYEEVHSATPARVRMQETRYEQSSWGDHNNGFYDSSCNDHFDDGIYRKRNNGGFQRSSPAAWIAKGI